MRHKRRTMDTIVCNKRRQKVGKIIEDKLSSELKTKGIEEKTSENSSNSESGNLEMTHKTLENKENEFNDHKVYEPKSDVTISHNKNSENHVKNNASESEVVLDQANVEPQQEIDESRGEDEVTRMPSPDRPKSGKTNHSRNLSTILENIKGEEKELKKINNPVKVQSDYKENVSEVTNERNKDKEPVKNNTENKMSKDGISKVSVSSKSKPDLTNSDVIISEIEKVNKSLKCDKTVKQDSKSPFLRKDTKDSIHSSLLSRPLSSQSDPGINKKQCSKKPYTGIRFTKRELDYYLPRRSTFSCHEKALKDAGYDLDAMETKKKRRFMRRVTIKDNDVDEKLKEIEDANKAPDGETQNSDETKDGQEEEQTAMERLYEKMKRKGKKKDEYEIKVDHTVLLQYLKYVLENQEEYFTYKRHNIEQNSAWLNVDPSCTIARFGRAFQRGQHGQMGESFLLELTHGIKSNYGDGPVVVVQSKDKQMMPGLPPLKTDQPETTIDEKDKTEYEKMKNKLDKWLKTVTTAQLIKAKELALKELGEEDKLQTQWLSMLQPCRYLRQRTSLF